MQVRNGDLSIESIGKLPKGLKKVKDGVILRGKATGHAHKVVGGDVLADGDKFFIKVAKKATLKHEEHKNIELPKGIYQVIRQIEFNGYDNLVVED